MATNSLVFLRYFCILSSLASYSSKTCLTTMLESLLTLTWPALSSRAIANPVITASYSASLLVVLKPNLIVSLNSWPTGVCNTIPVLLLLLFTEPSTWIICNFFVNFSSFWKVTKFYLKVNYGLPFHHGRGMVFQIELTQLHCLHHQPTRTI
jgi:hypothetical protein